MFDENIIVRADANGSRNRASPSINQVAVCLFGPSQVLSLVAVSQTLNKLIVRDLSPTIQLVRVNDRTTFERARGDLIDFGDDGLDQQISYITTRDVINSLATSRFSLTLPGDGANNSQSSKQLTRDLLLIGCSNSIVIYDTCEQTNLFNINTSAKVTALLCPSNNYYEAPFHEESNAWSSNIIFAGGVQKLCLLHVDKLNPLMPTLNLDKLVNIEITSERSISDTISCLCHGRFDDAELVLTGSVERKIRLYTADTFDYNIQAAKLTLNESAKVNCLCSIPTTNPQDDHTVDIQEQAVAGSLPAFNSRQATARRGRQQMNYFAYGLENGFIGVYRLISIPVGGGGGGGEDGQTGAATQKSLFAERLWRHKSRQAPIGAILVDINGDGLDELVFGYSNGRLEARSPFTGQLLAKTRCFRSDDLISLTMISTANYSDKIPATIIGSESSKGTIRDTKHQVMLLACSASMSFIGYHPRKYKPHRPLIDHLANRTETPGLFELSSRTIDEVEENENWTSSLVSELPAQGPQNDDLMSETIDEPRAQLFDIFGTGSSKQGYDNSLMIEAQSDNHTPVNCEGRQNSDLLLRISSLHAEQARIEQRVSKTYYEKIQQLSIPEPDSISTGIHLAHQWDFDSKSEKLRLGVLISNLAGWIELLELADRSGNLIAAKHLLVSPSLEGAPGAPQNSIMGSQHLDDDLNLLVFPIEALVQESEVKLNLRVYYQQLGGHNLRLNQLVENSRHNQMLSQPVYQESLVSRIYEKALVMPRFSMFVPRPDGDEPTGSESETTMRLAFKLSEHTSHLQILDWMRRNFLCFQFGQLMGQDREMSWTNSMLDSTSLRSATPHQLFDLQTAQLSRLFSSTSDQIGANQEVQQHLIFDSPENWSSGQVGESGEMELDLKLQNLRKTRELGRGANLSIKYTLTHTLMIECEDIDELVAIVDSLVIDCLRLNIKEHAVVSRRDGCPKLDAMAVKLASIGDQTRQLEESERRIQTELYESADMTKSLMQQLAIANQLNEFGTSKELLNEISMMLDGAQNSARAFQLNNHERMKMSKEANHLREKMSLLLECK